ncbi:MAG: TIGR03987 family protein [Clostridiales bacterium]|nr:TIGR03987 family protein [Clostridiales bacterium]
MSNLLIIAIIFITLALVFYTIGVFGEKKKGELTLFHTVLFWLGFVCDTVGTNIMSNIAGGGFSFNIHSITGLLALLLMGLHAIWATIIIIKKDNKAKRIFHKFSIFVWIIWLVPYILGILIGMK